MDANQTRFHLLLGAEDWGRARLADGATPLAQVWNSSPPAPDRRELCPAFDEETQELTLWPELAVFAPGRSDRAVSPDDRRGAALDRYGNWYVVAPDRGSILCRSSGSGAVSQFWPPPSGGDSPVSPAGGFEDAPEERRRDSGPCLFGGLVVTRDHHLVAVSTAGAIEILAFDLFAGGPPIRFAWPAELPLVPLDLAARDPGGFWLLDGTGPRLWEFNTYFQVVRAPWVIPVAAPAEDFGPVAAGGTADLPRGAEPGSGGCAVPQLTARHALPLAAGDPVAVEPLPGGGALVLHCADPASAGAAAARCFGRVEAYRDFSLRGSASLDAIETVIDRLEIESDPKWRWPGLNPHDFAVVERSTDAAPGADGSRTARLHVADVLGNQSFSFLLRVAADGKPSLEARAESFPMRLFGGRALVAADGRAYYDSRDRFVPLVEQERPRYSEVAIAVSAPLDSEIPGCVWHRILLEACVPGDTRIEIASRVTDADGAEIATAAGRLSVETALAREPWEVEPVPVTRRSGPEIPWLRREATGGRGTVETLIQRARGRYLQLRLTLIGDGQRSPRVRALRVYYPRYSYAQHYLPACYRDDAVSASFLERFLANFEGQSTALEDAALALGTICEPTAAPAEFLDWLGRWYAVYLDPSWPPARKRFFLRHAMTFFQWRGTARGLRAALRLAFDDCLVDEIFTAEGDAGSAARRYRIAEDFRRRPLVLENPPEPTPCPGVIEGAAPGANWWQPEKGVAALHVAWRAATGTTGEFPTTAPADAALAGRWRAFAVTTLGFEPAHAARNLEAWRRFLRCRYSSFAAALAEWRSAWEEHFQPTEPWDSFSDVAWHDLLPASATALQDWVVFHRILQPMREAAHRFTVSLPVKPQRARDAALLRVHLNLADRLVSLEKPSHTAYRMQLYWALFRVGEARLGEDTQIGQGSRLAELLPPFVLGEGALAEGRLSAQPADWAQDRLVAGRDALGRGTAARRRASASQFIPSN